MTTDERVRLLRSMLQQSYDLAEQALYLARNSPSPSLKTLYTEIEGLSKLIHEALQGT